jgi:hypothetical protein
MAPPAKVPPRVVFKEIYVLPYRFVQIHVGAITESEVFSRPTIPTGKPTMSAHMVFLKNSQMLPEGNWMMC